MKTTFTLITFLLLPAIAEAQQTLQPHDSVVKRFVPSDVDFGHAVYETSHTLSCRYGHVKVWPLQKPDAAARANLFPDPGHRILNENQRRLTHEIKLTKPGHYVFRARAKSDAIVAQMSVQGALDYDTKGTPFTAPYYGSYTMPFAQSDKFTVRGLPFVIENGSEPRTITASIEIKRVGSIELDSVELIRLGDTRLDHRWGQNLPVDPIHGLTTLKASPNPDQTGFEKFEDTWTGAEVWLVSQGLQSRLQYPGTPNFTDDGKYFYLTSPGYVLRTDGLARFGPFKAERIDSRYLPWPTKWVRNHLPSDRESSDWMITEFREHGYGLSNIVTGAKADIKLPKQDGWRLVKMAPDEPGTYVNADVNLSSLWISNDRKAGEKTSPHPTFFGRVPCAYYNGMIHPIRNYTIRGVIWYQGERNSMTTKDAVEYRVYFLLMINAWRDAFGQPEMPFFFVQLPKLGARDVRDAAPTRESQMWTANNVENTGMVVTLDVGEASLHPKLKRPIGQRLAKLAQAKVYGKNAEHASAVYKSAKVQGALIVIQFEHVGKGLMSNDGKPLREFTICGADRKFVAADAKIVGNTVVVSRPNVSEPVAVRYAWKNDPMVNLFGRNGLPVGPFRTDDFELKPKT